MNLNAITGRRRPKTLALGLVEALGDRIREGRLNAGDKLPTEAAIMAEFEVSRTVVREAISKLQAAGLVETRHGIGTFVLGLGEGAAFRIAPDQMGTLTDVVAVLELRIGVETEAAALAAQRRSGDQLAAMQEALAAFAAAAQAGRDAVAADFQFHLEIARATGNPHFEQLMGTLGAPSIPRARLPGLDSVAPAERLAYLTRVNAEHEHILDAISAQDPEAARAAMRTHLANSRERRRRAALAAAGGE
ncbi:FadR/GntR family transcriptional regulator [Paucibacter sp. PLA-PC-4]|uniref:FadR/GntR family transcriptional regulator n=1 Tax=Paucibacter sp. PLA-PC-4 TaxID=2993655 RepID=UPI0022498DC1|nr:FadR/GntR family transcriptional regulator [Paucibacter sp. PLA-PC-4]MCX2860872.1 FadR/GntR family transcriptional regulator [Paucibacter sp. PLA-PC-4]